MTTTATLIGIAVVGHIAMYFNAWLLKVAYPLLMVC